MHATDQGICISKAELAALIEHTHKDHERLGNVLFRLNGKATAVASDGHRLVRCEVPRGDVARIWETLIPRRVLQKVSRAAARDDIIEVLPDRCSIGDVVFPFERPTVGFPDYTQVIPEPADEPCAGTGCATKYLSTLAAIGRCIDAVLPVARIYPGAGELDPVRFDVGAYGEYPWTVIIMPVRL